MKKTPVKILAQALGADYTSAGKKTVKSINTDSRSIGRGDCFFAIKGENFDGHDYVKQAFENGAACAVVSKNISSDKGAVLKVKDTIHSLGILAGWYRTKLDYKVVAITGSAGKTTTREMIYHVLKKHFKCHRSPKSFNNNIGLPLTLLGADEDTEIVIAEIGSNRLGEIAELTNIASPDIAVITNVYPAHLKGLGSIENIIREKASISQGLKDKGRFIINGDARGLVEHVKGLNKKFITFGEGPLCDIKGRDLRTNGPSGNIKIKTTNVSVPLAGRANLFNTLTAWAVCSQFGISIKDFSEAIKSFKSVVMRLNVERFEMVTVINDCYNANPASMANAIGCLCDLGASDGGRKVFICGTMEELGDQSEQLHHELGKMIAENDIDTLLAVGRFAQNVVEGAKEFAKEDFNWEIFENTQQLCDDLPKFIKAENIVLVKGSRCIGLEKAIDKIKEISGCKS
ncbi:MAG: UDP-N-acetylmuramoyl-tripeptide--D-alanyl-D-alanine ligase [Sedimentisphaerales bacterium]|nr:UDP-N-acetylmuramoyl-tripeptide--D-alanyl-D-alanine ligase [Sedimentisphaerales bacterium]